MVVIPGRAKREPRVVDIFSSVQARVIDLMGGGAGEMVFLGDAPPTFMVSDLLSTNAIAGIVCSNPASIAAFVEHCYQGALAIIEQNKPVVLALARALINHPERTLNCAETDQVIMQALVAEAAPVARARGRLENRREKRGRFRRTRIGTLISEQERPSG
jgi:hypothetical protein